MAGVASLVGLGTSLYSAASSSGLFGGSDGNAAPQAPTLPPLPTAPTPQTWQAPGMTGAANDALGGISGLPQYNTYGQSMPQWQQAFTNTFSNPYAQQYQNNANTAAQTGWGTGMAQVGGGNALMGAGASMLPYAQQMLQMGFDPQNAIHDRTQQQLTDSTRAGLNARGIAMTPYGAGVENKSLSDFNIDWQNNLLNRANTGAQGAGYLTNSAGNAINLGQNVGTLGVQQLQNSAALPYSVANTIGNNQFGALNQFGAAGNNASSIPQAQIQQLLAYLGMGNQANTGANSAINGIYGNQISGINGQISGLNGIYGNQITAQNNQFNQGQTLGRNLGASMQGLTPTAANNNNPFGGLSRMFAPAVAA